jgi:hypothetical protein
VRLPARGGDGIVSRFAIVALYDAISADKTGVLARFVADGLPQFVETKRVAAGAIRFVVAVGLQPHLTVLPISDAHMIAALFIAARDPTSPGAVPAALRCAQLHQPSITEHSGSVMRVPGLLDRATSNVLCRI